MKEQLNFKGLTDSQVEESRRLHGSNILTPSPRDPWWKLYLEKFNDPIIRILLVAAVVALVAGIFDGHYLEGVGIVIAILLATTLGFINEYKAGQEFDELNQVSDSEPIQVIRNGDYVLVPKNDLVVGDIVVMEQGEEIPADAEVLTAVSFQVNESSLTGESVPVTKKPKSELNPAEHDLAYSRDQVLRGTLVSDGHALVKVTAVGDSTEIGKASIAASEKTEGSTPLNRQLEGLGKAISIFGFTIAILIFLTLSIKAIWQGDLDPRVIVEESSLELTSPSQEKLDKARKLLTDTYGLTGVEPQLVEKIEADKKIFILQLPLDGGRIYLLAIIFMSFAIAMSRIWLPILFDAIEFIKKRRPENRWLARKGFIPSLQAAIAGLGFFIAGSILAMYFGWLPFTISTWLSFSMLTELLRFFMVSVTIIVVSVPEGLPMSVTLSLAYSMRKMTAANTLVRHMHACETIGAATVICSDKTGTLTMNEMRVSSFKFTNDLDPKNNQEWLLNIEAFCANSTANLGKDSSGNLTIPLGNPTECAMLLWLNNHGVDYQQIRSSFNISGQLTFSTERKYMATIGVGASAPVDKQILHVKGGPEIVLSHASYKRLEDGSVAELSSADKEQILTELRAEQGRGMRTLGFAYSLQDNGSYEAENIQSLVEKGGLIWLGFAAIADPIRPEVPKAIEACNTAGVKVKMVTGDNQATAREIGLEIGMLSADEKDINLSITGDAFMALDDKNAANEAKNIKIMSRAKPLAKQRLVNLLRKQGEVVAVTGDGSNDAPALNHADVGLAMGITGTSVAKEAADIILLDDSFASIVNAIMWGRSLYSNIQKFILFQLTINVSALGVAFLGPFLGIQLPFTVTQMLWVNLIMDTFAALALASEPPDQSVMNKPPRKTTDFIVTAAMGKFILLVGGIFLAMFLILVIGFKNSFPMNIDTLTGQHNLTIFFNVFVFLQLWNLFNVRMMGRNSSAFSKITDSRIFLLIVFVIFMGQILITQFGGEIFRTTKLNFQEWLFIVIGTSPVLLIGELIRFVQRNKVSKNA